MPASPLATGMPCHHCRPTACLRRGSSLRQMNRCLHYYLSIYKYELQLVSTSPRDAKDRHGPVHTSPGPVFHRCPSGRTGPGPGCNHIRQKDRTGPDFKSLSTVHHDLIDFYPFTHARQGRSLVRITGSFPPSSGGSAIRRSPFPHSCTRSPFPHSCTRSPFPHSCTRSPFPHSCTRSPFPHSCMWAPRSPRVLNRSSHQRTERVVTSLRCSLTPILTGWLTNGCKAAGSLGAMGCQRCIEHSRGAW